VFPVELSTFFIKAFSNEGDVVLDIFGGSGTVAISCIDTNREFIIIEKEIENIELIKKRVEEKRKEKELTQKTIFGDGM